MPAYTSTSLAIVDMCERLNSIVYSMCIEYK